MSEEPYDVNFCFPVPLSLENDRIRLVPFIPRTHTKPFLEVLARHPEIFEYLPFGPFNDEEVFNNFLEDFFRHNDNAIFFAVYNKTEPADGRGILAGAMGYINSSLRNLCTEIGAVIILPEFQRTHVASNAVGLLLKYALNLPEEGGLGLRRVVWQANYLNKGSVRLAERLKFRFEGILRWDRVLPIGKDSASNGKAVRTGDTKPENVGRDTAMLSLCWDDWEDGVKEHVASVMARVK